MKARIRKPTSLIHLALTLMVGSLTIMAMTQNSKGDPGTLESALRSNPDFSVFTNAMDVGQFWDRLANETTITLLVPTNQALEREGSDFLLKSVLLSPENRARLKNLISGHITTYPITPDASGRSLVQTLNDECLSITQVGDAVKVGPEAFVLSTIKIGSNQLISIDLLLIAAYIGTDNCIK